MRARLGLGRTSLRLAAVHLAVTFLSTALVLSVLADTATALIEEAAGGAAEAGPRVEAARERLGRALIAGLGVATLASAALGFALSQMLVARLSGIRRGAEAIVAGDLSARIPARDPGDEFDALARTLNAMIARMEGQIAELRFVTDSLAHDLRSPLTRLRLHLDDAGRDGAAVARAAREVARIERVIAVLLDIARAEAGIGREAMAPLALAAVAADVAELMEPKASEAGLDLAFEAGPAPDVLGHAELLFLALGNLVENALAHAPAGSRVTIAVGLERGRPVVSVTDRGPGIPEAERARVLERFVRIGGGSAGRHGLGLALVAAVARLHGATLALADAAPGLSARLVFPAERPAGPAPSHAAQSIS